MNNGKVALQVEQNNGQQPFTTGNNQNIQNTGSSQQLGVPEGQPASSPARQQELMELLQTEAAGPSYSSSTSHKRNITVGTIIVLVAAFILICLLLLGYYRFFLARLSRKAAEHQVY